MPSAKMTSKGQITVPKEVRKKMGLSVGDEVEFVEAEGVFQLRRCVRHSPFERYRGFLKQLKGKDSDTIVKRMRGHE